MHPNNELPQEDNENRTCPVCWTSFTPSTHQPNKHTYCSGRCRAEAGRRRAEKLRNEPTRTTPASSRMITRDCPHCHEPIAIVTLLTTTNAARPTIPDQH